MVNWERRAKEFSESGHLETQLMLEETLKQDLMTKLMSIDPKDHMEFVSVRGMIEGIQRLQTRREELISNDPE